MDKETGNLDIKKIPPIMFDIFRKAGIEMSDLEDKRTLKLITKIIRKE